jgi:RND family efflux transporter MFP subunit
MRVKTGQPLFSVRTDTFQVRHNLEVANLGVVQARVSELEARLKNAQVDEQRYQRLVEVDQTVPRKKLEDVRLDVATLTQQLAAAQAQVKVSLAAVDGAKLDLRDAVVAAPFDGVITKRMKGLGDYLTGAPLVEVLELTTVDRLEAELSLPEAYFATVQPGKTVVTLRSPLLKSPLDVTVSRVIPQIDAAHGTFIFRAAIPSGSAMGLVPGAFVLAQVTLPAVVAGADSVLVPLRALVTGADGKTAVFMAVDGKMQRRVVAVESKLTEGAVIRSDLKPGMQVLTGPVALLQDGAALPADMK